MQYRRENNSSARHYIYYSLKEIVMRIHIYKFSFVIFFRIVQRLQLNGCQAAESAKRLTTQH